MARVERARKAVEDILEIWEYIAIEWANPTAADRLVTRFDEVFQLLSQQPESGVAIERIAPGLRTFTVGNYVIFYRPLSDGIRLIRILHGARKWEDLLGPS
jgi:toxin ParE1/3/4